jgi:hypothetical protein
VLRRRGAVLVCDTAAPENPSADAWMQKVEALRDPSHGRNLTMREWRGLATDAGFGNVHIEWWPPRPAWRMAVTPWIARQRVEERPAAAIRALFDRPPDAATREFLIHRQDGEAWFAWPRVVLRAGRE